MARNMQPPAPVVVETSALTPREAARYLRTGEKTVYKALGTRPAQIRHYRIGNRILIPIRELDAYQERLMAQTMGENVRELRR